MQYANIMLALGGDGGNTVPKRGVSAAEIAVLIAIHGESAVTDIEPTEDLQITNRSELSRLRALYGRAKDANDSAFVDQLFPGAAARVFETLDELGIDESFYKAETRKVAPPVKAAPQQAAKADPLDHDDNGRKGGAAPAVAGVPAEGLDGMTKAQLVEHAKAAGVEIDPRSNKADIVAAIHAAESASTPEDEPEEGDDGVGDMTDDAAGENLFK